MGPIDLSDENLQIYIEESREHLETIEGDLLAIEDTGGQGDPELVNKVFRAAHSIKGGAGFFGLIPIKKLSHKIENVLDLMRNNKLAVSPEVINILLLAFDGLRELINNIQDSENADVSGHINALKGLTEANIPDEVKEKGNRVVEIRHPVDGHLLYTMEEIEFDLSKENGNFLYLVELDLIHDLQLRDKKPHEYYQNLIGTGSIEEVVYDFKAVGSLDDTIINKIPVYLIFSTVIKPRKIVKLFEIDEQQVVVLFDPENPDVENKSVFFREETQLAPVAGEVPVEEDSVVREQVSEPISKPVVEPEPEPAPEPELPLNPEPVVEQPRGAVVETAAEEAHQVHAVQVEPAGSLRVKVTLLEQLMSMAGELVLSRNQLNEAINNQDLKSIKVGGQRINQVTSEIQEAIMMTRMQSIGSIFNKFPRVVRDLAQDLEKDVQIAISGKEVELDKTLIEGLNDPLTHIIRNAVDHGVETPGERERAGKPRRGHVTLKAYHEAGQVIVEISDDGKGIDGDKIAGIALSKGVITREVLAGMGEKDKIFLIFQPGLSSAEKVTDVSGRGVGMDVVKSNLDRLGGTIDIDSEVGNGTHIRIKLPLTLAIIPSLLVSTEEERYAIPQLNVRELLRIRPNERKEKIERIGQVEILKLRGELIPLLYLSDVLGLERTYVEDRSGERHADRRERIGDRRGSGGSVSDDQRAIEEDRRYHNQSNLNVVIATAGSVNYGLIVDKLHDSMEIVVKPLGRHVKKCNAFAGVTILGDGTVALILDIMGIAVSYDVSTVLNKARGQHRKDGDEEQQVQEEQVSYLVFKNAPNDNCAMPLDLVSRVEFIKRERIEHVGGRRVIRYMGELLPLVMLEDVADCPPIEDDQELTVIVFRVSGKEIGLIAARPVDHIKTESRVDQVTLRQPGIMGSVIHNDATYLLLDAHEIVKTVFPQWFAQETPKEVFLPAAETVSVVSEPEAAPPVVQSSAVSEAAIQPPVSEPRSQGKSLIIIAEDSAFFRSQLVRCIEEGGYEVAAGEDGVEAWKLLDQHGDRVKMLVTDIEMPNMDGYGLVAKLRQDPRFKNLPVVAVTSLAGEDDIAKGKSVGIDDYQVKLDREQLVESIRSKIG